MNYQHDLIVSEENPIRYLAPLKLLSKDGSDKIFIDKFYTIN